MCSQFVSGGQDMGFYFPGFLISTSFFGLPKVGNRRKLFKVSVY